jgi:fatty-acyl-CoA synthase
MVFDGYTGGGSKQVVDGYMSTGDVGHLDRAGRLFVGGREDDMIVSGGENVFPQEVEEVILRLPGVKEAIVVGVPDEQFGQRLAALVVPEQADGLTPDEVRQWVRDNLARHKVPRTVELSDELPRNPTGKVLRRVVAERLGGASDGTPG